MAKPIGKGGIDTPDWGVSALFNSNALVNDLSELAVRLGSPVTFDRTGNVLYYDCFESGLTNWEHNSYPAGAYAVPTARFCAIRPYAVKLATTDDSGSYSGIKRGLPFPYVSRMGFEFHIKQTAAIKRFLTQLTFYTGTYAYYLQLTLHEEDDQVLLQDGDSVDHEICGYDFSTVLYSPFHVIKLVFDLTTELHIRLTIDDIDYDVSSITIKKNASAENAHMYVLFYLYSAGAFERTCYIDNVIFTIDEPL